MCFCQRLKLYYKVKTWNSRPSREIRFLRQTIAYANNKLTLAFLKVINPKRIGLFYQFKKQGDVLGSHLFRPGYFGLIRARLISFAILMLNWNEMNN